MLVSWNWLKEYLPLDLSVETVTDRLTMTGLNLEGIERVNQDFAIDLEVTSNRPDCLGHIGVAREIGVLFELPLSIPKANPAESSNQTANAVSLDIQCHDLCSRYIARIIQGVKVGPSPKWLQEKLASVNIASVNNIVDITNYVLMETGQPLHAFDFDKLRGKRIVVRNANEKEQFLAINHKEYELDTSMCVIADAERAIALGGVMGGADTEVTNATTSILIEVADFVPLSIRATARALKLHSESSYRFERGIDVANMDWVSRRCSDLILQIAGGELLQEPVIAGTIEKETRPLIPLRYSQVSRILGIEIPTSESDEILQSLGLPKETVTEEESRFRPPSWRADLTREIDLIEEIARIHGYDQIPSDREIPMVGTSRTLRETVTTKLANVLTAMGFYEAITFSFTNEEERVSFTPFGSRTPLSFSGEKDEVLLRQSLIPSLLASRRHNERQGEFQAELYEIAKVFLETEASLTEEEREPLMISLVSGQGFLHTKGLIELLATSLNSAARITVRPTDVPQFAEGRGAEVWLNGLHWGWMGELAPAVCDQIDLRDPVTVAELKFQLLEDSANFIPLMKPLPRFPGIVRDLNFILDEGTTWSEISTVIGDAAGPLLEEISFGGQYRGKQIPPNKKSYVATLLYRSLEKTLTSEEVDSSVEVVINACQHQLQAELRM